MRRAHVCLLLIAVTLAGAAAPRPLRAQVRPDATWRSLETEHFVLTFEAGLEAQAGRAAERAERAYARIVAEEFVAPPPGRIDLILADNVDFSNGLATVVPSNRITVFVHPPVDDVSLDFYDDWLELVITHELTHVFHLDESRMIGSVVRRIFGRYPAPWPFFPGLATPTWTIEGFATYYESALTDAGRVNGTYLEMVVRTAALEGRFESLDRVSGRSPVWPDGDRPYAYGSLFFNHLLERYGEDQMAKFVHAVAGQLVPYRLNAAAKRSFGVTFSAAWREWRSLLEKRHAALADSLTRHAPLTAGQPLTHEGRFALYPRFSADGAEIAFLRSDGRSDPQIRIVSADGSRARRYARVNGVEPMDWLTDGRFLAAQLEYLDPYTVTKDLYLLGPDGARRLTHGRRLYHPDAAPDGRTAIAVQNGTGTNRLVRVDLVTGKVEPVTELRDDRHWAYPRWSADGRFVAVSRWRPGAYYDVVVLDASGEMVAEITQDRAVDVAATWSPDGRWLIWSSDRSGIPNLYAVQVDGLAAARAEGARDRVVHPQLGPLRQVTNVLGGAWFPEVSPDGAWITYAAYHADGWKIERIPFDPRSWFDPLPLAVERFRADGATREPPASGGGDLPEAPVRSYRAARALLPRFWIPLYFGAERVAGREVVPGRLGALTGGRDLVDRHAYTVWAAANPDGAWLEGTIDYSYAGLGNPVLGIAIEQEYDAFGPVLGRGREGRVDTLFIAERESRLIGSATLLRPRFRSNFFLTFSGGVVQEARRLLEGDGSESRRYRLQRPNSRLGEVAATLGYSNARLYAFSISTENGLAGFVRVRARRELDVPDSLRGVFGGERSFQEVSGQLRAYLGLPGPGFANHVLAARLSAGFAGGPGADRAHFELGGAAGVPEPLSGLELFGGSRLLFPVRGYPETFLAGNHIWSASAEYRVPLWLAHRGLGLWPAYLDRVAGTLFFDAGNAWGPERSPGQALASAGGELSARILPFWTSVLTIRLGVAGALRQGGGVTTYVRLGQAF
ncbi:MAG: PD40 domain-containing protein [Gemmatimonadetes bacterium]|nr:PD40 domain-containing protein [Gemmatimonadota bacterium]